MEAFIKFLRIDRFVQTMLIIITVFSGFTLIGLAVTLPILGAWQVISGIVAYYYLKDKKHAIYLGTCALVLSGMVAIYLLENELWSTISILLFIVIPSFMAFIYLNFTCKTLERVEKENGVYFKPKRNKARHDPIENLLDDELMFG